MKTRVEYVPRGLNR